MSSCKKKAREDEAREAWQDCYEREINILTTFTRLFVYEQSEAMNGRKSAEEPNADRRPETAGRESAVLSHAFRRISAG
jgi:hypothetical protein